MKKTLFFGLMAAALGFTACSSDDDLSVSNDNNQKKGMVLRATVEQPAETRATITDNEGVWQFAFATGDAVSVTNTKISTYYTFTNDGEAFKSEDAQATETDATWYAYFPSDEISLVGQSGAKADVANKYALAGATASATTGKGGLSITMSPKVAILVIDNQKGSIDINVKNSADTWVSGLAANADGFTVRSATSKQSILNATTTGTYYVAVPAGVQLAVKDGDKTIKSTGESGLTAGCYYNLTLIGYGKAYATGPDCYVNWVQLWAGGPKFAEYNVGASSATETGTKMNFTDATKAGADYVWGANWCTPSKEQMDELLKSATSDGSTKVGCDYIQENGVNGFKFTGKETGYTSNSVFFPAQSGSSSLGNAYFWSGTASGSLACYMRLIYFNGRWSSSWLEYNQGYECLVRPVLKN